MNNRYYVYIHSLDGEVFYVGKGSGKRAYTRSSRNRYWQNKVKGRKFEVSIIANSMTEDDAFDLEVQTISNLLKSGVKLTNLTAGGRGIQKLISTINKEMVTKMNQELRSYMKGAIARFGINSEEFNRIKEMYVCLQNHLKKS